MRKMIWYLKKNKKGRERERKGCSSADIWLIQQSIRRTQHMVKGVTGELG
jgi:hypothetical protein